MEPELQPEYWICAVDRCHLSPWVACRPKKFGPAGRRVGGGVFRHTAASRRQLGLRQGSGGPACQADRNPGTWWQHTETNTGAKMNVRQPGRSQAVNEGCWRVWLADWGQKAGSQGLGKYSRDWSQEQAGHLSQEGS